MKHALLILFATGCYSGTRAAKDVNAAWRGHHGIEIAARIGAPAMTTALAAGTEARWIRTHVELVSLPGAHLNIDRRPGSIAVDGEAHAGVVSSQEYVAAAAVIDPSDVVLDFSSDELLAGIPHGANIHTGIIYGLHIGLGGISGATSSLVPSTGMYIGGMIGPRLALLGHYSFVNGKGDDGFAMSHAWAFGVQHWATPRLAIMAGAAMALELEPGLANPALAPAGVGALSFAFVRSGAFVLDARLDATVSTQAASGMFGVGVNVN